MSHVSPLPGVREDELLEVILRVGDVSSLDHEGGLQQHVDSLTLRVGLRQSPGRGGVLRGYSGAQHGPLAQQVEHLGEGEAQLVPLLLLVSLLVLVSHVSPLSCLPTDRISYLRSADRLPRAGGPGEPSSSSSSC